MKHSINFHHKSLLRTPMLPFEAYYKSIYEVLKNSHFKEAIFLASPHLFQKIYGPEADVEGDERLQSTIFKYKSRISTRCTPFGLFAGINVVDWKESFSEIFFNGKIQRRTALDMFFLGALSQHLNTNDRLRKVLKFYVNTSINPFGDQIRYAEYTINQDHRSHILSSVDHDVAVAYVLEKCKDGYSFQSLLDDFLAEGYGEEEVSQYLYQLIDSQLIVSELDLAITEDCFLSRIIDVLDRVEDDEALIDLRTRLRQVCTTLDQMNESDFNDPEKTYLPLSKTLEEIGLPIDLSKLFQVDLFKTRGETNPTLPQNIQKDILDSIEFFNQIPRTKGESNVDKFVEHYYKRYEDKELPLLQVLDTDLGIGFPVNHKDRNISPILKNFHQEQAGNQNISQRFDFSEIKLIQAIIKNQRKGKKVLDVSRLKKHFVPKDRKTNTTWPASFYTMFSVINDQQVQMNSCGGVSAVALAARFSRKGDEIHDILTDISTHDKACFPDAKICDIIHLPEARVGNILKHAPIWDYEIPYLAHPNRSEVGVVALSDILVSVNPVAKKVILKDANTNQTIIPRLTNAHNFSRSNQPVYRFLSELQYQDVEYRYGFNMDNVLLMLKKTPRITYRNLVIQPAAFHIEEQIIKKWKTTQDVQAWQEREGVPDRFIVVEGDNYLFFDTQYDRSLKEFLNYVSGKQRLHIKEFLFDEETCPIRDASGKAYFNEVLSFITVDKEQKAQRYYDEEQNEDTSRYFKLGDEWVYFKIYCGTKIADQILSEKLFPLSRKLYEQDIIDKWFFIRYNDPDFHIRVRFHLKQTEEIYKVLEPLNEMLTELIDRQVIFSYQADIYKREMERYGNTEELLNLSEQLFAHDSDLVCQNLGIINAFNDENLRWQSALLSVHGLVEQFGLNNKVRHLFFKDLKESFEREFRITGKDRKWIEKKYKKYANLIEELIGVELSDSSHQHLYQVWKQRSSKLAPIVAEIEGQVSFEKKIQILRSYIHMTLNRFFLSRPRQHELFIYYFLSRVYTKFYFIQRKKEANVKVK